MGLDDILIITAAISAVALFITFVYLFIAGNWMLLEDDGQKGWYILIPIWHIYAIYKMSQINYAFIFVHLAFIGICAAGFMGDLNFMLALIGFVGIVVMNCVVGIGISHRFNAGASLGIGIGILPPLFVYILAKKEREYEEGIPDYNYAYDDYYYIDDDIYDDEPLWDVNETKSKHARFK